MLIFGTRGKILGGPPVQGQSCPNCGQSNYLSFGVVRYFHIFWIPVFPYSKKVGVECTNCKHTATGKEVPDILQDPVRPEIFSRNKTLPLFTGSVLIAGVVAFGAYSAEQESSRDLAYIQNPVANDVYVMDFSQVFEDVDEGYRFGVMRVEAVDTSTIELIVSNYGYDRASIPAADLRRDMGGADFFGQETMSVAREDLVEWKQSNVIRDVRR
jgi:hypothetical protein